MTRTEFRSSIAARLALLFGVVAVVGFCLIALTLNLVMKRELERHQYEQIQSRMEDMRYMLLHSRPPGIAQRAKEKVEALTPSDGRARYWLASGDPEFRYGNDLDSVLDATNGRAGMVDLERDGRQLRALRIELPATLARPAVSLIVGVDTRPFARTQQRFNVALVLITAVGVLLVSALGYWAARVGLAPVVRLSRAVREIGPGNRAQRLALPALPLELAELGSSFNAALDRLEDAYHQLATFNDDVAHELRTPLAILIGQTQVTLSRERDASHLQEVLQSNLEELERLRLIVADMLFLARADQGEKAQRLANASIAVEVGKTVEFMELLLDDAGLQLQVQGDQQAAIETSLFRRAVTNLIHNAIQYASAHSTIRVEISSTATHARIAVTNQGEVIAPEHIAHIFDRFYRVDTSRTKHLEHAGHGLGLAIVRAVATMHAGAVFAVSQEGQTTVGFSVAIAPPAAPESTSGPG